MRSLTCGPRSWLVGDEVADVLLAYAAALGRSGGADVVAVKGVRDGHELIATILLNAGTALSAETAPSRLSEPDNGEAVVRMRDRLAALESWRQLGPGDRSSDAAERDEVVDAGETWVEWTALTSGG